MQTGYTALVAEARLALGSDDVHAIAKYINAKHHLDVNTVKVRLSLKALRQAGHGGGSSGSSSGGNNNWTNGTISSNLNHNPNADGGGGGGDSSTSSGGGGTQARLRTPRALQTLRSVILRHPAPANGPPTALGRPSCLRHICQTRSEGPVFGRSGRHHTGRVFAAAFSPTGVLATGCEDGRVLLWSHTALLCPPSAAAGTATTSRPSSHLPAVLHASPEPVLRLAWSPHTLAVAHQDGNVDLWTHSSPASVHAPASADTHSSLETAGQVYGLDFDPTNPTALATAAESNITVWDAVTARQVWSHTVGTLEEDHTPYGGEHRNPTHETFVFGLSHTPGAAGLLAACSDGTLRLLDTREPPTFPPRLFSRPQGAVTGPALSTVACSPAQPCTIATTTIRGMVEIWDLRNTSRRCQLQAHEGSAFGCDWAGSHHIVTTGLDQQVSLWEVGRSADGIMHVETGLHPTRSMCLTVGLVPHPVAQECDGLSTLPQGYVAVVGGETEVASSTFGNRPDKHAPLSVWSMHPPPPAREPTLGIEELKAEYKSLRSKEADLDLENALLTDQDQQRLRSLKSQIQELQGKGTSSRTLKTETAPTPTVKSKYFADPIN